MKKAGIAILIIAAAVGAWVYYDHQSKKPNPSAQITELRERAKAGAFIESTKKLSENEELSVVVLPSSYGEFLDTRCVIYRHREFKQATFSCPDSMRYHLDDND